MASSDDEADGLPQWVSNYYFEDDKDEPISFAVLPIQWKEGESQYGNKELIFLHGTTDNGLQKIYKHVIAWRFDLSDVNPQIYVLSKENNWIKLQKPRKSFEDIIRTILITVHCLHFLKKNPEASGKSLWDHLSKVFSLYEVRPSQIDLADHLPLLREAVTRDDTLAKSKFLCTFLNESPGKTKLCDENVQMTAMSGFIVDDVDDELLDEEDDESNEVEDVFDSVCAFCDNGGNILCCDGRCMRSFHATEEDADTCESLGLLQEEVDGLPTFVCKNCEYKQHQCFACGKLGSSDKFSGAEVFPCVNATCGYFYHPCCVAKLLHEENKAAAEELEKTIAAGGSFTCPIHKCCVCKQGENKKDLQLQLAVCRRCPNSYHRKCLPREIAFEDIDDEDIIQRAWEGLLPNRILIYCLKHEIDGELGTPVRDHIKFPGIVTAVEKKKETMEETKKKASDFVGNKVRDFSKKKNLAIENLSPRRNALKTAKQNLKLSSSKNSKKIVSVSDISRKGNVNASSRKLLRGNARSVSIEVDRSSTADENKPSLGNRLYDFMKGSGQVKPIKQDTHDGKVSKSEAVKLSTKKLSSAAPSLDADRERSLLALMRDAASSITLEEIKEKHKVPCGYAYSSKYNVDKNITLGKLEGSMEAIRAALGKLEEGFSLEDAEAVCEPAVLKQIFNWKQKLRLYLAPFLYGNRYTSYGRHFTKMEKLQEIVDKLHLYVQNGDMIVDFCCGANDFSVLMKKKLEETGKKCSFRNYDIFQAKIDFNFEKRDWMTVQPKELPTGSRLIMGLNPPFGVRASLANKFIDKALEFNPKLLILIVPPETERLDKKKPPYDLVWDDEQSLSGKSFYLPGSVDDNEKQMDQWNVRTPPLSLWSRHDWSAKHKIIAEKHGHLSKQQEELDIEKNHPENRIHDHPVDSHDHCGVNSAMIDDLPAQTDGPEKIRGGTVVSKCDKESSPRSKGDGESLQNEGYVKNLPKGYSKRKRKHDNEELGKQNGEISSDNKMDGGRPRHASPNIVDSRSSLENSQTKSREIPSHTEIGENGHQHFEPSTSGSRLQFAAAYGGNQAGISDDMGRMYYKSGNVSYSSGTHWQSMDVSPGSDYRGRNWEEQLAGRLRGSSDSLSHRSYGTRVEEMPTRDSDIRSQVRLYGQQDPDLPRHNYLAGHDHRYSQIESMPSTYGHPSMAADFSSYRMNASAVDLSYRMNTSAMQRYAPRLDELNQFARPMNTFGFEPSIMNVNGFYNYPESQPPRYQNSPMGFVPNPRHPYPH
ncbi:hypothetical protein I3760_12G131600 [Carya illinoinensis]|uniref:Zinc finger PHD-type domain-containing protein n=1 Tax=Carya illinoinensis TaxID=32201 RepID=A0A922IX46_CARIL|nr:hypothetical protein I3760_12G131600 [Carya illinoinensis]KAG2678171.1 hypothetical protein I3760_12G131600 [Carya illinoinensis]KAG2678172.1 hypothetical protein I3760_12G131600 [Carya illinoinensis]KAG6685864.1 hypothetical protein I3842_12G133600 [Carya illinoinensis]KAG6685867.1 hypothetical protein I3842_12G133600 [Carya illinoinensis]